MTNRERLQENYEDALFAMLMDDLARQEGERLLRENEALKEDPAAAVPEAVERRCLQTIDRELHRRSRRVSVKGAGRAIGRLAIAAVLVVALFTTAFAASPSLRAGTLNMLLSFSEKAATWRFFSSGSGAMDADSAEKPPVRLGQLPEGYSISSVEQDPFGTTVTYADPTGETIVLSAFRTEEAAFNFDIEDADYYEETTVHGHFAVVLDKLGLVSIAWLDETQALMISIDATDLSAEELKTLADGVIVD